MSRENAPQTGVRRRLWVGALVVAAVAGGGWFWNHAASSAKAPAESGKPRTASVVVQAVEKTDMPIIAHSIGRVTASASVAVKARVEGLLQEALFQEGQMVKAGDVLFRLDPQPFEIALREAEAILARDQAQLTSARADVGRYGSLSQKGYASTQQLDQTTAQARALAATVAADQAAVDLARVNLGYTEIRAPISGKTGAILLHPGNLVKGSDSGALVTLTALSPIRIALTLPQQDIPVLQRAMAGGAVTATINETITAKVDFVAPQVDANSGTVELRATAQNEDLRLVPGEFVRAAVALGTLSDVLVLPLKALNSGQTGSYVYVVTPDNKAEVRFVSVLRQDGERVAVAPASTTATPAGAAVLTAGDSVVVDGQLGLAPGMAVKGVQSRSVAAERGQ